MDMRSRRAPYDGGNCFATARIALAPRGVARALAVRDVRRQAELLRLSPRPRAEWLLTRALVRLLARWLLLDMAFTALSKATLSLASVGGPRAPERLAGAALRDMNFLAFLPVGLCCTALTYAGHVSVAIVADPTTGVLPGELAARLVAEFDALHAEARARPRARAQAARARARSGSPGAGGVGAGAAWRAPAPPRASRLRLGKRLGCVWKGGVRGTRCVRLVRREGRDVSS